jgi:hypothetical protein
MAPATMPSIASVSNILLYFLAPPKALEFDARVVLTPGSDYSQRKNLNADSPARALRWYKKPPTGSDPYHQNHLLDSDAALIR